MTSVRASGERKLVSILFVDLTGYTALSASLDPEEVYRFLRPGIVALQRIVEEHGGTVPQILGDGFMAVFGVPTTHEDDAERAVRAAIAVRDHVSELNAGRRGIPFPSVHAGVNSGEVMVAPAEEAAGFAVIGDAVNTASRLADLAPAGRILVDERTRARSAHAIRYGPRRERRAKGKPAPLATFEALAAAPDRPGRRTSTTTFVDRRDVIERIRTEIRLAAEASRSRVLLLTGEPGAGKSRLAAELRRRRVAAVAVGRCSALGPRVPLQPVADAVRAALGLAPSPSRDRVDRAAASCARAIPPSERAGFARDLRLLLGVEDVPAGEARGSITDAARAARLAWFAIASERPLVVVLDDLHWADEDTVEFVRAFHRTPVAAGILCLGLSRPTAWHRGLPATELEQLGDDDMRTIAQAVAGADLPARALATALERAAGNPLFLEEIVGMLVESGAVGVDGRLELADPEGLSALPSTIRLQIAARLDGLPPDEKAVLQAVAVAGGDASEDLLEDVGPAAVVRRVVRALEGRGLLVRGPSGAFEVKHVLIRDVAYESLPRQERARRHRTIADRIRRASRSPSREEIASMAHHYERAWTLGRSRAGPGSDPEVAASAARYLARWAEQTFAYQARLAEQAYDRALAVARSAPEVVDPGTTAGLLVGRAESLVEMGRHADAETLASEALDLAVELGDAGLEARALLALGRSASDRGQTERARRLLQQAQRRFRARGDARGEAWTLHRLSETWSGLDYRKELDHLRRAHDLFDRSGDRWGKSVAAHDLAYVLSMTGGSDYRAWHARARRLSEDEGDVRSRAALARTDGYATFYRGRPIDAIDAMSLAQPLAARAGDRYAEADAVLIRALAEASVGGPDAAEASAEELLGFAKDLGSDRLRVTGLLVGARAAQRSGRRGLAGRRLAAADRLVEREHMTVVGAWAVAFRGQHDLDRGDFAAATAAAARVGVATKRFGWDLWLPLVPLLRGRAALGRGRLARASTELGRAADLARRVGADGTERLAALLRAQCAVFLGRRAPSVRPLPEDPEHRALAQELRGARELVRGRPARADDAFAEAVEAWRTLGTTCWMGRALALRAAGRLAAGDERESRALVDEARHALSTVGTPRAEWRALLAPPAASSPAT